ncbi:MAG: putative xylan 1,4-beta-xylosidase, partial [Actinomyces urogenitalis DORA_12]
MTSQDPATASQKAPTFHHQDGGPTIGTCDAPVIEVDGHLFKDLARTGELLPYEDWRLSASERAADLAGRLSIEQIAGLMLYSPHQAVPNPGHGPFPGTYGGG